MDVNSIENNTPQEPDSLQLSDSFIEEILASFDVDSGSEGECTNDPVSVQVFNAMGGEMTWETPWDFIRQTVYAIVTRLDQPDCPGSEQEQALLPLLRELNSLHFPAETVPSFPLLKALFQRCGCKKGVRLLTKMEKCKGIGKKYASLVNKLLDTLNKLRWEPIWREIYIQLRESQAQYPSKAEALCPQELLQATRSEIWQRMEQYGYLGSYPKFFRKKFLPGIHLEESYGVCYWVGMKRNTRFHVHCFETVEEGKLCIRFVTGTALLRRTQKAKDVFACLFNGKGRRFSHSVQYEIPLEAADREGTPENSLAQHVKAAVKKAALRPLSRKEKKAIGQTPKAGFGTFMKVFLLGGGLFALTVVGIMMLAAVVAMYFVDGMEAAKTLLLQFPWWVFLAGAWLLYGLFSASVTVAARNK